MPVGGTGTKGEVVHVVDEAWLLEREFGVSARSGDSHDAASRHEARQRDYCFFVLRHLIGDQTIWDPKYAAANLKTRFVA